MNAAAALAILKRDFPALPPDVAPVYFLMCGEDVLTAPAMARRLSLAQSTVLRNLALLAENGLVQQIAAPGKLTPRWALTPDGRVLAGRLMPT